MPPRPDGSESIESTACAGQAPANQSSSASLQDDWEIIPLAGMSFLETEGETVSPCERRSAQVVEAELQARVNDLNQCNEVLLSRVHQLEEALERSQQALQQEVERSHRMSENEKVAAAQSHSVAELLRDLEQSNAALDRQTILAETLGIQLQTFQERTEQLETECVSLRQQVLEKTQHLQASEDACTDLRSRLQRQQRYTLQFKAALEKCLDASTFNHTSRCIEDDVSTEKPLATASPSDVKPLSMPRSERIQPWSAGSATAQADPQLLSLMRVQSPLQVSDSDPVSVPPSAPPSSVAASSVSLSTEPAASDDPIITAANNEAEKQLWQDVERVINNTAIASEPEASPSVEPSPTAGSSETQFTEPIPWGAPVQKGTSSSPEEAATTTSQDNDTNHRTDDTDHPSTAGDMTSEERSTPANDSPQEQFPGLLESYRKSTVAASMSALDVMNNPPSSPSPLVHPLKPTQRKRKSLSAVELPSFPPLPKVKD